MATCQVSWYFSFTKSALSVWSYLFRRQRSVIYAGGFAIYRCRFWIKLEKMFFKLTAHDSFPSSPKLRSVGPSSERSFLFLRSYEGPTLKTLNFTIRIGSTSTILYFDLYLYSACLHRTEQSCAGVRADRILLKNYYNYNYNYN